MMCKMTLVTMSLVLLLSLTRAAHLKKTEGRCRCVPNQWEGTIISTEREFQLYGGQALSGESSMTVHYDFENQLLATREVETGMKSIEDYKKSLKYVTDGQGNCHTTPLDISMEKMCIPERAVLVDEFRLGANNLPVAVWKWINPENANYSRTTTVDKTHCFPVSEETSFVSEENAELYSYLYINISLGITDPSVFQPETSCEMLVNGSLEWNSGTSTK